MIVLLLRCGKAKILDVFWLSGCAGNLNCFLIQLDFARRRFIVFDMVILRGRTNETVRYDHWLARAGFGLFMVGLAASLVALYWTAPLDL
jgi:hypothetical protein